eukprot:CAMPEP_0195067492 /NCGR_PEP_ID=MMETSP0448-20130528/12532_1 /TAXON_ID=66468 /ORGANISM="Heterocapsa triquestra, Strain CCMP 448" /LENGTH=49 /DNA_ID= /DNA_START= /DNA_END= /DNA_ORIENTATION=
MVSHSAMLEQAAVLTGASKYGPCALKAIPSTVAKASSPQVFTGVAEEPP